MTLNLEKWIAQRLNEDASLSEESGLLILAALEGPGALGEYLEEGVAPVTSVEEAAQPEDVVEPVGAFLRSVTVEGFRGIGEPVTLELQPQPGLTIVAGRNGSGKSSLAEALEVALTGSTYRWANKSLQWKEQWRNLHHGEPAQVSVQIAEEGEGLTTVGLRWDDDATDPANAQTWVQRPGQKQHAGLDRLGWHRALTTYRPMMSYDELGGMLEAGPSHLYDALSSALGVEQISEAIKALDARAKQLRSPEKELGQRRRQLAAATAGLQDERAAEAVRLFKGNTPDTSSLRAIATGAQVPEAGIIAWLRDLEGLVVPVADEVVGVAGRLAKAVAGMVGAGEELGRQRARLDLRQRALQVHERFGDMSCPVCAAGELDGQWAEDSRNLIRKQAERFRDLELAQDELDQARAAARRLLRPRPDVVDSSRLPGLEAQVIRARSEWDAWVQAPEPDQELADHLVARQPDLESVVTALRTAAVAELQARQDLWAPLAGQIAAFCRDWDNWMAVKPRAMELTAAVKWLKENDTELKNQRLEPIADQARHAWSKLRQESNVDLGSLRLEGTTTRRRVTISASVDGTDAGALAVMSQGELHALALSLFLPRASLPDSPFRFIVLDDPVQAMDPAKVDGLIQLLSELAQTRQVIVLSHDDRLPAAARRGQAHTRILEVTRGTESRVSITTSTEPSQRYLDDAHALVKDQELPKATLRRALPGILRFAVESAARDTLFGRRLAEGEALADLETLWTATRTTRDRVSLAVFDEVRNLDTWTSPPYRKIALAVTGSAMHAGLKEGTDPYDAHHHVKRLVQDIRNTVKA